MKLEEALEKIYSMHQFSIKLGMERITKLLAHLGDPQKKLKTFHVAGSNGKGSTSSFIASILIEAGYKVGLFTSPHFEVFNERVRINGVTIPDDYITEFIAGLDKYIIEHEPTFFELTTALGFKYFSENNLDFAVIETGLGGRLDATNVLSPLASLITSISLEHTNILGTKLEEIATEKAGIIKTGSKLFIGKMPEVAETVIANKADELGAEKYLLKNYLAESHDGVSLFIENDQLNIYKTGLNGYHQYLNSALAIMAVRNTIGIKDFNILNSGILNVVGNSGIQGRYEFYHSGPDVIFDAAHNYEGVGWFIEEFKKETKKYKKRTLVFGAMRDKEISLMLKDLSPYFDEVRFAAVDYERAMRPEELCVLAGPFFENVQIEKNPALFVKEFIESKSEECLVLLGSIYLLGKIKEELKK